MNFRKQLLPALGAVAAASLLAVAVRAAEDKKPGASATASPAPAGFGRVGVVNIERVSRESIRLREEIDGAQNRMLGMSAEHDAKSKEAQRQIEELARKRSLLSADEIARREKEILDLRDEIDSLEAKAEREFKRTEGTIRREMARSLRDAADELGRTGGFDLLLASDTVLFAAPGVDVTDQLIAIVDAGLPATAAASPDDAPVASAPHVAQPPSAVPAP